MSCVLVGPIGDRTHAVTIRNRLDRPIIEYSYGRRDPTLREMLAPGETLVQTWRSPIGSDDGRKRRVEADDDTGKLVFCADYGYQDLLRVDWTIDVVVGFERCPP